MTFDARETSTDLGRPVELFEFGRDYQTWRYTSADREVTAASAIYKPRAISRTAIETSSEKARSGITITAPRDLEVAELFRVSPPTLAVTCIVRQYHEGDAELVTIWTGRVSGVKFTGISAEITCDPVFSAMRRIGLRRLYQRQCPHVLYNASCGVNRETFRTDGTTDAVTGSVVSVPQADLLPDGWFAGGYIEWEIAIGIVERRFITDHTAGSLTLSTLPYGLTGGTAVKVYPGCDHLLTTCSTKFSNVANYGGFPYFPLKNPFGGDPIF